MGDDKKVRPGLFEFLESSDVIDFDIANQYVEVTAELTKDEHSRFDSMGLSEEETKLAKRTYAKLKGPRKMATIDMIADAMQKYWYDKVNSEI